MCLTACADQPQLPPPIKIDVQYAKVPAALFDCPDDPGVPVATQQSEVANYIIDLHGVADCRRDNLNLIRPLVKTQ